MIVTLLVIRLGLNIAPDLPTLPKGNHGAAGYGAGPVVDISQFMVKYRTQFLEIADGKRYTNQFPGGAAPFKTTST